MIAHSTLRKCLSGRRDSIKVTWLSHRGQATFVTEESSEEMRHEKVMLRA